MVEDIESSAAPTIILLFLLALFSQSNGFSQQLVSVMHNTMIIHMVIECLNRMELI